MAAGPLAGFGVGVRLAYDLPKSFQRRHFRDQFTHAITPHIEPDSIVITAPNGLLYCQFVRGNVRIATPVYDDYHDLEALIQFHLDAERPVYAWLEPRSKPWLQSALQKRGIWPKLRMHQVFEHEWGRLIRIDDLGADADQGSWCPWRAPVQRNRPTRAGRKSVMQHLVNPGLLASFWSLERPR